jgi:atypical dual specificity phosphatase
MQLLSWVYARTIFYPTLFWNMLLGRWLKVRNWWDVVDENIVLGAFPFASDVEKLASIGVKAVVNTCEEYAGPVEEYAKHGIEQFRMPTVDFTHPSLPDVTNAVEFIKSQVGEGRRVYIHCKAGRARSATVAICWLMKNSEISKEEGQQILSNARPHINQRLCSRPVVIEFESLCRGD